MQPHLPAPSSNALSPSRLPALVTSPARDGTLAAPPLPAPQRAPAPAVASDAPTDANAPPPGVTRTWMPALQSLRGVAAAWVVAYHLDVYFFANGLLLLPIPGLRFGWLGVDLFFVLSAYLLAQPFFAGKAPRYGRFMTDRFLRVAPAYYVALGCAAATVLLWNTVPWSPFHVMLNVFYLGNFDLLSLYAVNPVFWTLAVEMQFYVVLPVMALGFRGRRWPVGLAVCLAISLLYRALLYGKGLDEQTLATFTLPAFLGHFALGLCAARLGPITAPVGSGVRRAIFVAGIPFVVVPPLLWIPQGSIAFGIDSFSGQVLVRPLCAVGFTLLVLATASGGWPARVLQSRPLAWLGGISYSLYLMHLLALTWTSFIDPAEYRWNYALAYLVTAVLLGWGLHAAVEAPVERWRRRRKLVAPRAAGTAA